MVLHVTLIHKRDVHTLEFSNTAAISDVLVSTKELYRKVEGPQLLFKGREVPSHAALASLTSAGMSFSTFRSASALRSSWTMYTYRSGRC